MHCLWRLRFLLPALLAAVIAGGALADAGQGGTSYWIGHYDYAGNAQPAVPFTLVLRQAADGSLEGATTEPPTFGNGSSAALSATVKGVVSDGTVQFTKTYDGSGGQSHAVQYAGTVTDHGRSMQGTWHIDTLHGTFQATLVSTGP